MFAANIIIIVNFVGCDTPAMRDLSIFVVPHIGSTWFNLGLELFDHNNQYKVHKIKDHNKKPDELCTEMFKEWIDTAVNPTWKDITKALQSKDVNLKIVADDINQKLVRG